MNQSGDPNRDREVIIRKAGKDYFVQWSFWNGQRTRIGWPSVFPLLNKGFTTKGVIASQAGCMLTDTAPS